jgi:putative PIN family toxin of toxin-antitoxin system
MRVVLDTNVWISNLLLPKSIPGKIITAWQHSLFKIVISESILEEIKKVLHYPKINKRLIISSEDIDEYLTFIRLFSESIEIQPKAEIEIAHRLRDVNDISILATLVSSNADYLITGDQDLLILYEQYPIITPKNFLSLLP